MKQTVAAILFLIIWPVMVMASPQISVPETHWEFGNVPMNSIISHDYWIRNTGSDSLKIIEVRPG
jgi:hypothetical protein